MIGAPREPRSCLANLQGPTINAEGAKVYGWNIYGILVVSKNDDRLNWPERELVRQLGEKLYGREHRREM
jgi:hypothetical protein